jgi:glucose-6-phosphate isomerase
MGADKGAKAWMDRCRKYTFVDGASGFQINFAGMKFGSSDIARMSKRFGPVHKEMKRIEAGAVKNPDEKRKVTHFTDRIEYPASKLFKELEAFAKAVRGGKVKGSTGRPFESAVINGIGGSALGPQLLQFAVNGPYWN